MNFMKKIKNTITGKGKKNKAPKPGKVRSMSDNVFPKSNSVQNVVDTENKEKEKLKKRSNSFSSLIRRLSRGKKDKTSSADKYKGAKRAELSKTDSGVSVNTTPGSDQTHVTSETGPVVRESMSGQVHTPRTEEVTIIKTVETQASIEKQPQECDVIPAVEVTSVEESITETEARKVEEEKEKEASPAEEVHQNGDLNKGDVVLTTATKMEQTEKPDAEQQTIITTITTTVSEITKEANQEIMEDLPIAPKRIDEIYKTVRLMEAKYMQPSVRLETKENILHGAEKELDAVLNDVQTNNSLSESQLCSQKTTSESTAEIEEKSGKVEETVSASEVVKQSSPNHDIESVDGLIAVLGKPEVNNKPIPKAIYKPAVANGTSNGVKTPKNLNSNALRKPIKSRQQMQIEKRYFKFGASFLLAMVAIAVYFVVGNGPMNVMTRTFRK